MKKRIVSILICLCMVMTLLPATAWAADAHASHPVCGASHTNVGDHTSECRDVTWTAFSDSSITDGVLPAGNYYLTEDLTLSTSVNIKEGTVSLCLNGHKLTVTYTGTAVTVGALNSPATLNICDCGGGGELVWTGTSSSTSSAVGISIGNASTVNLYSGTIRNTGRYGETVNLTSNNLQTDTTTFNMYGGKVCHEPTSSSSIYGVVYANAQSCAINIYGGEVSTNEKALFGAIYADSNTYYTTPTTVLIAGGVIKGGGYGLWLGAQGNQVQLTLAGNPTITCADEDGAGISLGGTGHGPLLVKSGFNPTGTISVRDTNNAGVFAQPESGNGSLESYAQHFVSAKEGYFVECNGDGNLQLTACEITEQPSADNGYTVTANGGPVYQWYPATSAQVPVNEDNATKCEGVSFIWNGSWTYDSSSAEEVTKDFFTIDLRQGDMLELTLTDLEIQIDSVSISDGTNKANGTGNRGTYTLTAPADGTYTLSVSASLMPGSDMSRLSISFKATVTDDVPDENSPLSGQTSNTLNTNGLDSGTYICQVTWEKKTIRYSDTVAYSVEPTPPKPGEGYTIDYDKETITVESGYEVYTTQTDGTKIDSGSSISDYIGKTIYIRKTGTGTVDPSDWTEITLHARPDAPSGITVSHETIQGKGDGAISGITGDMEYKIGNGEWQKGTGQPLTGLAGGTEVIVRVAATGGAPHGAEQTYTVQASAVTLTVTFDSNGGSAVAPITGLSYNEAITAPTDPTKANSSFVGWCTDAGCTQAWNFSVNRVTDDLTLYAKWSAQPVYSISGTVEQEAEPDDTPVSGATVQLKKGAEVLAATVTDGNGKYTFTGVLPGEYNIVVTKDDKTKTTLVTITNKNEEGVSILLPKSEVSSVVKVKPDTPAVVVGGLDDEAANHEVSSKSVVVTLTVEGKAETKVANSAVTAIKAEAKGKTLEYIDMTVTKTVMSTDATESETAIKETTKILEIVVPFQTSGRNNITVYRHHEEENSTAETKTFDKLTDRPDSGYADGKYYVGDGYLVIYAQRFSTYAIGYTVPSSTGGSSGESFRPTYPPETEVGEHGDLTVTPSAPKAGDKVTITPKPSEGYEVDKIAVTDRNGKSVEVIDNGDGTYSFTQPSGKVTISVTYREIDASCDGGVYCPSRTFTDLSVTAWYHEATDFVLTNDIMGGYGGGLFGPNDSLSRAQLCQILYNLEGKPAIGPSGFTDVAADAWYSDAVIWANSNGIVGGYGGGLFGPNDPITREQLATILYRYAQLKGYDTTLDSTAIREFSDYESISSYAVDAMTWAVDTGVIGSCTDKTLEPQDGAIRAQVAAMLMRFLKNLSE